jgi:hypothetical protein
MYIIQSDPNSVNWIKYTYKLNRERIGEVLRLRLES